MKKLVKTQLQKYTPTGNEKIALLMENVASMERRKLPNGDDSNVLYALSLSIPIGDRHGITGENAFELQLISEIIGNVKPHETGHCSLMEIGMMRRKRVILPHVYYINDQRVLFEHMHVLGYLMFASEHAPGKPEEKQANWLNLLLRTGLFPFTFTYIRSLSSAEYAIVSALAAYNSKARLIVMDFSHIDVPDSLIDPFSALLQEFTTMGKTVVLATRSQELVQRACHSASFLIDGTIAITAPVTDLCTQYDRRILIVRSPEPDAANKALKHAFPTLDIEVAGQYLSLYRQIQRDAPCSLSNAADVLAKAHVPCTTIDIPQRSLQQAYREVTHSL